MGGSKLTYRLEVLDIGGSKLTYSLEVLDYGGAKFTNIVWDIDYWEDLAVGACEPTIAVA